VHRVTITGYRYYDDAFNAAVIHFREGCGLRGPLTIYRINGGARPPKTHLRMRERAA